MMNDKSNSEDEDFEARCKKNLFNVLYSLKPLYRLQPWLGIFPGRINNEQLIPASCKMKILGLWIILVYWVVYCSSRFDEMVEIASVIDVMEQVPGIVMLIQYITSVIVSSFLVDSINIQILTAFADLDTLLCVETINDFYKKSHAETVKYLIIFVVIHILNCIGDFATAPEFSMSMIGDLPIYLFQKMQILGFQKLILMVKYRLTLINEYLSAFVEEQNKKATFFTIRQTPISTKPKLNFIGHASEENIKIRDLASMYDLIGRISLMINEAWNYQILISLVSAFIYIVVLMWLSLYYYRMPNHHYTPAVIANLLIWGLGAVYTVAVISYTCEQLLLVRKETKILVNKVIMNYNLPKTMRIQAKAFMDLIKAWPLCFYVYDMFSVDITLMLKFISVSTTYLIVVIQVSHYF